MKTKTHIPGQEEAVLFSLSKSKDVTSPQNNYKFNADSMKIPRDSCNT